MNITIIFGSEMGTTEYVAKVIQQQLQTKGHTVNIHNVIDNGFEPNLKDAEVILFGSPTYHEGQLQSDMADFISQFQTNLNDYKVAVFSLGAKGFAHFCGSAVILEKWIQQQGGQVCIESIKIDGYPHNLKEITEWINELDITLKVAS